MDSAAYRDQVVIVTGASAGIGRAIAVQLACWGARVVIDGGEPTGWKSWLLVTQ